MPGTNGIAGRRQPPRLSLADYTPERLPVPFTRDGQPVTLWGYAVGKRTPLRVLSAIQQAQERYNEGSLDDEGGFRYSDAAYRGLICDILMAVIPEGLELDEAEVLSGGAVDDGIAILRYLGAWQGADDEQAVEEANDENPLTISASSPA